MTERITSRRNPLLEQVRRLDTAALRRKAGVFLCDSPKLVGEAVQHGVSVQCVIAADGVAFPEGLPENVRRVTVPADVMASISPMPTPQGMLALCALPDMAAPARLSPGRYVVLDGVQDPGNVGAVLRTADAFGCTGALLLPGCADPYGPKTLRAAMGAVFRLPLYAVGLEENHGILKNHNTDTCRSINRILHKLYCNKNAFQTQKTCICIWKETAFYTGSHSEKSAEDSISRWKSSWTKSIYE